MGLLDWLFGKPARKRRAKRGAPKKVCPKRTKGGKKVHRDATGCHTRKRVKKVAKKRKA